METDSVMEIDPGRRIEIFRMGNGSNEVLEVHDFKNVSCAPGLRWKLSRSTSSRWLQNVQSLGEGSSFRLTFCLGRPPSNPPARPDAESQRTRLDLLIKCTSSAHCFSDGLFELKMAVMKNKRSSGTFAINLSFFLSSLLPSHTHKHTHTYTRMHTHTNTHTHAFLLLVRLPFSEVRPPRRFV